MRVHDLKEIDFLEARSIQNDLVQKRAAGKIEDSLILCEHPKTITFGKRSNSSDLLSPKEELLQQGYALHNVDRAGGITYHGPGQLLIYPVIHLKENSLGIKSFVSALLKKISLVVKLYLDNVDFDLDKTGLWVFDKEQSIKRKIAFCGLRIQDRVSNHGFSLNIDSDLEVYSKFVPCGIESLAVTSIAKELGVRISVDEVKSKFLDAINNEFN